MNSNRIILVINKAVSRNSRPSLVHKTFLLLGMTKVILAFDISHNVVIAQVCSNISFDTNDCLATSSKFIQRYYYYV